MGDPTLPAYGSGSLAEILPSIAAHLGVPGALADPLGLPAAKRYVVLLVDGLGWLGLRGQLAHTPYFAEILGHGRAITCGVPSTTATSLASVGTGLPPGGHGIAGYTFRDPDTVRVFNALGWDTPTPAERLQPKATWFERAADSGVLVSTVAPARFEESGLTRAVLRGAEFLPVADERDEDLRVSLIVTAAKAAERSLVYAYERELDHAGHVLGVASDRWLEQLIRIDALCERLRATLPDDTVLLVTGDHGMVDIPQQHRLFLPDEVELLAGVAAVGGEPRFRHVYSTQPEAVLSRWADRLGERAWVRLREDAILAGWFGDLSPALVDRFGDVVVAMRDDWAVMSRDFPKELSLVGMHGSLTPAEMLVPLLAD